MMRLWNLQSGTCVGELKGHVGAVRGVRKLADGRLLSWSDDCTMRLWDGQSRGCLTVREIKHYDLFSDTLEPGSLATCFPTVIHRELLRSNLQFRDLMSFHDQWSAFPPGSISSALELADGRLLSRSDGRTIRLWDGRSGACLGVVDAEDAQISHPEWLKGLAEAEKRRYVSLDFNLDHAPCSIGLCHQALPHLIVAWHADSALTNSSLLLPNGTAVAGQKSGQICFLKLHHGHRRMTLAEAEAILVERGELPAVSQQPLLP